MRYSLLEGEEDEDDNVEYDEDVVHPSREIVLLEADDGRP